MIETAVLSKLRLARAYCAERLIWFSPALYQCKIFLNETIAVAAIDLNYNIYFNPKVVQEIIDKSKNLEDTVSQLGFIWVHEISHLLRDHADRATELAARPELWNVATDLEINDSQWKGLKIPEALPFLLPRSVKLPPGKLAEWYYRELLKDNEKRKCANQCLKQKGFSCNSKNNTGKENQGQQEKLWDEGSGIHGKKRAWEVDGEKQKLHPIDRKIIVKEVAKKIKEHQKSIGRLPGSWNVWVEKILTSKTDWRKILRHRMSTAITTGIGLRVDYSFLRPSRRQSVYKPIITPSFSGSRSGRIAIVVDTSGSMRQLELGQAVAEVCKVVEEFKLPVTVIPCDVRAYEPIIVKHPSDRFKVQKLKGGGGTNMTVGIEAALALKPQPDTVLILTDGFTPYPEKPFKIPVIFGIIKHSGVRRKPPRPKCPPWPETAVISIEIETKR